MSLQKVSDFIGSMVNPLATVITEKITARFGKSESPLRHMAIQSVAFVLLLIPLLLVALMLVGMTIFSFQMLYSGI